jgi:hypothetical protein
MTKLTIADIADEMLKMAARFLFRLTEAKKAGDGQR